MLYIWISGLFCFQLNVRPSSWLEFVRLNLCVCVWVCVSIAVFRHFINIERYFLFRIPSEWRTLRSVGFCVRASIIHRYKPRMRHNYCLLTTNDRHTCKIILLLLECVSSLELSRISNQQYRVNATEIDANIHANTVGPTMFSLKAWFRCHSR